MAKKRANRLSNEVKIVRKRLRAVLGPKGLWPSLAPSNKDLFAVAEAMLGLPTRPLTKRERIARINAALPVEIRPKPPKKRKHPKRKGPNEAFYSTVDWREPQLAVLMGERML